MNNEDSGQAESKEAERVEKVFLQYAMRKEKRNPRAVLLGGKIKLLGHCENDRKNII